MSYKFLRFLCISFLTTMASYPETWEVIDVDRGDITGPNAPSDDWESLMFLISNNFEDYSSRCRKYSAYYCLDAYETPDISDEVAEARIARVDEEACKVWFDVLIRHEWRQINYINELNPQECCTVQVTKYLQYGLRNRQMMPDEYFARLTDYKNESRPLNHISACYSEDLCRNVIVDVGFGPGPLRLNHCPNVVEGTRYMILGNDIEDDVGIPNIPSIEFNYHNLTSELTFHWFKHNIMCAEHPWICEQEQIDGKSGKDKEPKKKNKPGGGSKKSRRKQKNGGKVQNEGQTSQNVSVGGSGKRQLRRRLLSGQKSIKSGQLIYS